MAPRKNQADGAQPEAEAQAESDAKSPLAQEVQADAAKDAADMALEAIREMAKPGAPGTRRDWAALGKMIFEHHYGAEFIAEIDADDESAVVIEVKHTFDAYILYAGNFKRGMVSGGGGAYNKVKLPTSIGANYDKRRDITLTMLKTDHGIELGATGWLRTGKGPVVLAPNFAG